MHTIAYFLFVAHLIWLFDSRIMWSAIVLWPAFSFAMAGLGYLFLGPAVFGKGSDGNISLPFRIVLAPFFGVGVLAAKLRAFTRKTLPCHEIISGMWLGEYEVDLPKSIERIIDLTSEYPRIHPQISDYFCIPTLDGKALDIEHMATIVQLCIDSKRVTYVHCFAGKGRSATFVAAFLLKTNVVNSITEAEQYMKNIRSVVKLGVEQKKCLKKYMELYC